MSWRALLLLVCLLLHARGSDAGESPSLRLVAVEVATPPVVIVALAAPCGVLVIPAPPQGSGLAPIIDDKYDGESEPWSFVDPLCALTQWGVGAMALR